MDPASGRLEDQDEVPECRICRCEGDEERPLFYPCACTGSIKWCHESCLVEWIKVSRTREHCETCGKQLVFKPVYSDSTPAVLPFTELIWLSIVKAAKELPFALRAGFVGFVWLIFVPIWSASAFHYLRPGDDLYDEPTTSWQEWFASRPAPITFLTWETGVWILLAGFFSLFMLVSVFDFVRGFEMGEFATELEALRQRAQQQGVPLLPEDENGGNVANLRRNVEAERNNDRRGDVGDDDNLNPMMRDGDADLDMFEEDEADLVDNFPEAAVDANNNNDNANNNNAGNANRNELGEDFGGDQLGFDEWIGLRGPWCLIMNNVMCLCFCILMFLVTFYVIPESLGRGVYREINKTWKPVHQIVVDNVPGSVRSGLSSLAVMAVSTSLSSSHEGKLLSLFSSTVLSSSSISNHDGPFLLGGRGGALSHHLEKCPYNLPYSPSRFSQSRPNPFVMSNNICEKDLIERNLRKLEQYQFEAGCVLLGLVVTMVFIQMQFYACSWSWKTFMSRALRPTSPLRGMPHFVWKSVLRSTRTVVRVQKVVCLLIFKMIAFPIVLGVLIDRALSPAINLSDEDRIVFITDHPHLTVLVLWVTGITHTLLVTMNVIMVRDILHQEVLDGIIRMRDPHGNQFLPLLVEPLVRQTKRTLVTCLIYTMIVYLFISIPCRIAQWLNVLPLPLSARFVVTGIQLPVELTLFHMWMLHVLERSKPFLLKVLSFFFSTSCSLFGLSEFLLPMPNNQAEYTFAVQRAQLQAGQLHWLDSAPRVSSTLLRPRQRPKLLWPRILALLSVAWTTWLTAAALCLAFPYFLGVAAVSCLPAVPVWVKSDVRLYFLGWLMLRSVIRYAPRLKLHITQLMHRATSNHRDSVALVALGLMFGLFAPILVGSVLYLRFACGYVDFPGSKFNDSSAFTTLPTFVFIMMEKTPLLKAWIVGSGVLLFGSIKTGTGRHFWRYVFDWQLKRAGMIAAKGLLFGYAGFLSSVLLGLEYNRRINPSNESPLTSVNNALGVIVMALVMQALVSKHYIEFRDGLKAVHDALKDEKYLMGRRLSNYEPRVGA